MLKIIKVDLHQPQHARDLLFLLNSYACDPMGGGEPLSAYTQQNLIAALQARSTVHSFLAYQNEKPAGFAICIEGFSTFACKPLLNIHDFAVHPDFRGLGISKQLMGFISNFAQAQAYCKMTLEVLEGNTPARTLYLDQGFVTYELDPSIGGAIMMQKKFASAQC
ncbi:GNAT family N-acetyltransferase [Undibacterium sp. SXout20W]|uniref:GNAT family N-acetyltransferase n=1 Tax=Undibacterium sp. SXout20W TaxID=3413051 RepID=UPI003BF17E7F